MGCAYGGMKPSRDFNAPGKVGMEDWGDYSSGSVQQSESLVAEDVSRYRAVKGNLVAWQNAIALGVHIYEATRAWPNEETYGLTSQIRRAAVSVAANIAEGQGRNGDREFLHHLSIANGSLREVDTFSIIAHRAGLLSVRDYDHMTLVCGDAGRPLRGLIKHLKERGS